MEQLIKLVRTYRLTAGLAERLTLAEAVFRLVEPQLRFFVFAAVRPPAAEDVLQETLKSVATSLGKFTGDSTGEFWAWAYRIARNRINDHHRKSAAERLQPMPPDELRQLVDASAQVAPLSPQDRLDLDYAMKLLSKAKPECYDFLWTHFILGLDYAEIAEERNLNYDSVRMKIARCLDTAQALLS